GALLEQTHTWAILADILIEVVRVVIVVLSVGAELAGTRCLAAAGRLLDGRFLLLLVVLVGGATARLDCSSLPLLRSFVFLLATVILLRSSLILPLPPLLP
ncbi:hypothetical protein PMAYCL1PPCAC_05521, partial [Pristionchus mayeri]